MKLKEELINKCSFISHYESWNYQYNRAYYVYRTPHYNDEVYTHYKQSHHDLLIKNGYVLIEPDNNPANLHKMYYKNIDLNKILMHIKLDDYYSNTVEQENVNVVSFVFTVAFMNKDDQKICKYTIPVDLKYSLIASLKKWHYFNLLKYILTDDQLKSLYEKLRFLSNVIICKRIETKLHTHLLPSRYDYILSFDVKEK